MPKRVIVLALENISNAGDELLGVTVQWLAQQGIALPVERRQFTLSIRQTLKQKFILGAVLFVFFRLLGIASKKLGYKTLSFRLNRQAYHHKLHAYYDKMMQQATAIILAGGMLKYTTQNLSYVFDELTQSADKYNIPLLFNAQSVQKKNPQDSRYLSLVKSCNRSCVKMITTRDGQDGLKRLRQDYIRSSHVRTGYVGDPALWTPECFKIHKFPDDVIGINVIRPEIYKSYGTNFSAKQLMEVYVQLIQELDKRKQNWVLFCNGMPEDYAFGRRLLTCLKLSNDKLLPAPKNSMEFVNMLCEFKVVFAARLHACITSFALDIPFVGLLWDDKLRYFAQTMGLNKFFLDIDLLTGENIVELLDEACKFKIDTRNRDDYKMRTQQFIKEFLMPYCVTRNNL